VLQCNYINRLIVLTEYIIDVREGQNSDGFDRYPFEEAENESFSLLYEEEISGNLLYKNVHKVTVS